MKKVFAGLFLFLFIFACGVENNEEQVLDAKTTTVGEQQQAITEGFWKWLVYSNDDDSDVYNWWTCNFLCDGEEEHDFVCAAKDGRGQNSADTQCSVRAHNRHCTFISATDTGDPCNKNMIGKE